MIFVLKQQGNISDVVEMRHFRKIKKVYISQQNVSWRYIKRIPSKSVVSLYLTWQTYLTLSRLPSQFLLSSSLVYSPSQTSHWPGISLFLCISHDSHCYSFTDVLRRPLSHCFYSPRSHTDGGWGMWSKGVDFLHFFACPLSHGFGVACAAPSSSG